MHHAKHITLKIFKIVMWQLIVETVKILQFQPLQADLPDLLSKE